MDLWEACRERVTPIPLAGDLLRIVESQEQVATSTLVDDLTEQALLEEMLEGTKPALPPGAERLHYLLAAPFRYPPLLHGSRFGSRQEPSLFYGSKRLSTLLAEAAYYRFVFWTAMETPPVSGRLLTQHTVFRARYRTDHGLRLQNPPCAEHELMLTDPSNYRPTQRLGTSLRKAGVRAFEFVSARDRAHGVNVALFEPDALFSRKPLSMQPWLCETRDRTVRFSASSAVDLHEFAIDQYLVADRLPCPAG